MTRRLSFLMALAVAGTTMVGVAGAQGVGERAGKAVDKAVEKTGAAAQQMLKEDAARDVRTTLVRMINDGVKHDGFGDFMGYLSKADRDRLGDISNVKFDELNARIDQFRTAFKNKYNQDFDLKDEHIKDLPIHQGQDKEHAWVALTLAEHEMPAGKGGGMHDISHEKMPATPATPTTAGTDNLGTGGTAGPGAMAGGGGQEMTLKLINEGTVMNAWRVDIPDTLTVQQLRDSLTKHLGMVLDGKDKWPNDAGQAYRQVGQHVLESLTVSPLATEK